jgi:NAD(P)-dependent dehydrogenase (short-subunit alcohol dehydrogenase family)
MQASKTSPFDLTGKRILISGAAGGIGSATARLCAEQGAQLVLIDIVSADIIRERVGEPQANTADVYSLDTGSR